MASEFLLAYHDLIRLAENNPVDLALRARSDPALQGACDRIAAAASTLRFKERYSDQQYAANVPQAEIDARRQYELRWAANVASTDLLLAALSSSLPEPHAQQDDQNDPFQEKLDSAVDWAKYNASSLNELMQYIRDRVASASEWDELPECLDDGLRIWDELRLRSGFDAFEVLARLELVPFVLIPSDVSTHHGTGELISLFSRLRDAQRAFIFGCYLSSAALQRALLEDVLQRHYLHGKMSLPDRINRAVLPLGVNVATLHAINVIGNDVLHFDREASATRRQLLENLVNGLEALKILIERAR